MFKQKGFIAIIPARGGSKRIPKKNIKLLLGRPLICYSIQQAKEAKYIDEVYVSTDNEEISEVAQSFGATVIKRPKYLATDISSTEDVIFHVILSVIKRKYIDLDNSFVVLLQPTSPLKYSDDIEKAIEKIVKDGGDSLLGVCKNDKFLWSQDGKSLNYDFMYRPRSQDKKWEFIETGALYITRLSLFMKVKNRICGKILFYEQSRECGFEIDDEFDWKLVEYLMKEFYFPKQYSKILGKIKLVIMDVDGVLTDGGVYYDSKGERLLKFNRRDGKGLELLRKFGYIVGAMTSENSQIVKKRAKKLKFDFFLYGVRDKRQSLNSILKKYKVTLEEVLFIGDDIQDLEVLEDVRFSACPFDSIEAVKNKCVYICKNKGGEGAVREVIDLLLKGGRNEKG